MTLTAALARLRHNLLANSIEDAGLVAEVILMRTLGFSRAGLYLDAELSLSPRQERDIELLAGKIISGEPLAYVVGSREFYGRDLQVDSSVLIPRPETETLVEAAVSLARRHRITTIADIGTGSGAVAVTLALELPDVLVYATDISSSALEVARRNCEKHGVSGRVILFQGDLLDPLPTPVELVVANLPYVRSSEITGPLSREPRLALDGGPDGLDIFRRLITRLPQAFSMSSCLLLEIGAGQGPALVTMLRAKFPDVNIEVTPDLASVPRVLQMSPIPARACCADSRRFSISGEFDSSIPE